ncbi:hypothetical protein IF2G_10710 [Cordyceps javanica]|nr:hypothetical protein IF2G_10710 [Cordyceps javanica]
MPAAAGMMRISTTLLVLASALLAPSYSEPAEVSTSVIAQARRRHVRINRPYVVRGYNASTSATTLSSSSSTSDSTVADSQGQPSTVYSDTSTSAAVTVTVTLSTVDSVTSVDGTSSTSPRTTETEREPSSIRGSFPTPAPIVTTTEPMSTSHAEEPSSSALSTSVSFDIPSPEPIVTTTQSVSTSQTKKDLSSGASLSTGSFEAPPPVTPYPSATATTFDAESSARLSDDQSTTALSGLPTTLSGSSVLDVVQSSQSPKPVTSRSRVEESTFRAGPVSAKKDIELSLSLKISLSMSIETSSASALTSEPEPSSSVPFRISQSAKNGSSPAEQTQTSLAPTEAMPEGTSEATSSSTIGGGKTSFFPGSTSRLVTTTAVKPGSRSAPGPSALPTDPVADPPQTTRQQMKKVGLTTGAVSASILCGIVVFFLSNWYRRRRELRVARPSTSSSSRTAFDTSGRNIVQRQISGPLHVQSSHNFFRA